MGAGNPGVSAVCPSAYLWSLKLLDRGGRGRGPCLGQMEDWSQGVSLRAIDWEGSLFTGTLSTSKVLMRLTKFKSVTRTNSFKT